MSGAQRLEGPARRRAQSQGSSLPIATSQRGKHGQGRGRWSPDGDTSPFGEGWRLDSYFVTLRYYGRHQDRFVLTKKYPEDVCGTFMAVCVDLPLNTCVQTPPEMRVPWVDNVTAKQPEMLRRQPLESAAGTYVYMTAGMKLRNAPSVQEGIQLWSGCDATCESCAGGTGLLYPVALPAMCTATAPGGVFAILYNPNNGRSVRTDINCVDNLADYYTKVTQNSTTMQLTTGLVGGGSVVLIFLVMAYLYWRYNKRKVESERNLQRMRVESDAGWERAAVPPVVIGRAALEARFPVVPVDGEPMCVVCLASIPSEGMRLQCGHVFHADCILSWWLHRQRQAVECPLCKQPQLLDADEAGADGLAAEGSLAASA